MNRRITALQYCVGFCHTTTRIRHKYTCVFSLLNLCPSPTPSQPCRCYAADSHCLSISHLVVCICGASLGTQMGTNLPAAQETWVQAPGWEDPLEKGMATHPSILAWRIPWTKPGRLQSMGWQRVRHDWAAHARTHIHAHTHTCTCIHTHTCIHVSAALSICPSLSFPCCVQSLLSMSVSLFLSWKQVHQYRFSRFCIHPLIYNICFSLSHLLHSV